LRAQCVAHKEKQWLNRQIVIIHEFQLSEILKRADFYRDAQIINPSTKPSAISEIVNDLIGVLSPSWLLANWYTTTFLDWACRYKEGHSQVIKVTGTNKVCCYT